MATTEAEYEAMARSLPEAQRVDLLRLGRGARARLLRDGDKLCVKVGGKIELTSRGHILRSHLIRAA